MKISKTSDFFLVSKVHHLGHKEKENASISTRSISRTHIPYDHCNLSTSAIAQGVAADCISIYIQPPASSARRGNRKKIDNVIAEVKRLPETKSVALTVPH